MDSLLAGFLLVSLELGELDLHVVVAGMSASAGSERSNCADISKREKVERKRRDTRRKKGCESSRHPFGRYDDLRGGIL